MSNRRVKSLAADEDDFFDDYDDYYDDQADYPEASASTEMTEEDRRQMQIGTIKVRQTLGPAYSRVPTKDIEDALWNYYYDVDKSVAYLKSKHKAVMAPPTKTTPPNKEHSAFPEGRLLGGASKDGKMSKLQALAAKRLQQAAQKASSETPKDTTGDEYTQSLDKLRISQAKSGPGKADDLATTVPDNPITHAAQAHSQLNPDDEKPNEEDTVLQSRELRAQPSAFASVLTKMGPSLVMDMSPLPENTKSSSPPFDFSEPTANTPKLKVKDATKASNDLTSSLAQVSIEPVKVKSKNINVVAEYNKTKPKNVANFVVIGHVDAGKSTLMGRLLFDLKAVDQRTMDKYKKEADRIGKGSFAFAWVLDQGSEERERGVTIDIATNKFDTDRTSFTILDAPGHRDFVPNMIAGACQADFAVLVIDASTGNFESGLKGQTKEHAILVRSIGVQKVIVAVNKMDTVAWSQDRFHDIQQQMLTFLLSAGFQTRNISFVPCSGLEGGNILKKASDRKASWYTGPTLVDLLDSSEPYTFALDKPLRMTINDVFRGGIQSPLSVSGRIEAGNLQVGEAVLVMPSGEIAHIKALDVDDEPQDWAVAGQNVTLHLAGIDPIHLKTGDVICSPTSPIRNISEFKARLLTHDYIIPMTVDLHRGRLHVPGRISKLIATLDKATSEPEKKKPKIVPPQSWVRVLINLDQPVPLEPPARVVLRSNGDTFATGIVE
ncbi:hypothetical protein DV736_g5728, partial [Chaetothyriales sp. CBS 134916]